MLVKIVGGPKDGEERDVSTQEGQPLVCIEMVISDLIPGEERQPMVQRHRYVRHGAELHHIERVS